jgi:hypothetical protein
MMRQPGAAKRFPVATECGWPVAVGNDRQCPRGQLEIGG